MTKEERKRLERASLQQTRVEDEMAMLELARKRMEYYQSKGYTVPNLEETMKYSMRRDPGAERFYKQDGTPYPLPENRETNFVTGLGDYSVQKPNPSGTRYRRPTTTANYIRNPDLSVPVVDPEFPRRGGREDKFDTINIDKELMGGPNKTLGGPARDFNLTASDIAKNPVLGFPLEPGYGHESTGDIRMHEGMHKAYDYAFRSPFFGKRRGDFLGGDNWYPRRTVSDEDAAKQVDYNRSISRGQPGSKKRKSREHKMIYSATTPPTPQNLDPDVVEDTMNWQRMIGQGYGDYNKKAATSSLRHPQTHQGSGLAAMQVEAYRRGMTENELFCEIFPDDPRCVENEQGVRLTDFYVQGEGNK
jgi:hypothetical protein|tara:strand:- start:27 stop:1109 length:1083 start_codon:yes stop_codon:yes gene_type:complete